MGGPISSSPAAPSSPPASPGSMSSTSFWQRAPSGLYIRGTGRRTRRNAPSTAARIRLPTAPSPPILWVVSHRRQPGRPVWPPARRWSPVLGIPPLRPSASAWWSLAPPSSSTAPPCSITTVWTALWTSLFPPMETAPLKGERSSPFPAPFAWGTAPTPPGPSPAGCGIPSTPRSWRPRSRGERTPTPLWRGRRRRCRPAAAV